MSSRTHHHGLLLRFLVGLALAAVLFPAAAAADQSRQGSLELRRIKRVIDGDGRVWLSLQLANHGNKTVTVTGIAPSRFGPWSDVGKAVEPNANLKTLMKIVKDEPTTVWFSTSEGLCVFQLPAKN
jgi:hypothetical protein